MEASMRAALASKVAARVVAYALLLGPFSAVGFMVCLTTWCARVFTPGAQGAAAGDVVQLATMLWSLWFPLLAYVVVLRTRDWARSWTWRSCHVLITWSYLTLVQGPLQCIFFAFPPEGVAVADAIPFLFTWNSLCGTFFHLPLRQMLLLHAAYLPMSVASLAQACAREAVPLAPRAVQLLVLTVLHPLLLHIGLQLRAERDMASSRGDASLAWSAPPVGAQTLQDAARTSPACKVMLQWWCVLDGWVAPLESALLLLARRWVSPGVLVDAVMAAVPTVTLFKQGLFIITPPGALCPSSSAEVVAALLYAMVLGSSHEGALGSQLLSQLLATKRVLYDVLPPSFAKRLEEHEQLEQASMHGTPTSNDSSAEPLHWPSSPVSPVPPAFCGGVGEPQRQAWQPNLWDCTNGSSEVQQQVIPQSRRFSFLPNIRRSTSSSSAITEQDTHPVSAATAAEPCAPAAPAPCAALTIAQSHAQVSVLFADIVGFTTLVSTMTAQAAMDMLNDLYSRLDALSQRCGVYKIETVGDCYVAASGLQQEDPQHALHILRFAADMTAAAAQVKGPTGAPLQLRIGIHSGPVTSGIIGSIRRRYCIFGDTVNMASRMESTATPGYVHISSDFMQLVQEQVPDARLQLIWQAQETQVKGKGLMRTFHTDPAELARALKSPGAHTSLGSGVPRAAP